MRTKTFEGFTINLTEKQFKDLKKRFNPDNYVGDRGHVGPYTPIYRNTTPCLCTEVRAKSGEPVSCFGCPFYGPFDDGGLGSRGRCGSLFRLWEEKQIAYAHQSSIYLGSTEVRASGDHGLVVVTAIYNALMSFKRVS